MPKKYDFPKKKGNSVHLIIFVPSTEKYDKDISAKEFKDRIKEVSRFLTRLFGGTTKVKGIGSYQMDNKYINEKVVLVESFTTPSKYNLHDKKVKRFLIEKKKEWGQDSMGYEFEETMYFV